MILYRIEDVFYDGRCVIHLLNLLICIAWLLATERGG
jgi:hypothetical protein